MGTVTFTLLCRCFQIISMIVIILLQVSSISSMGTVAVYSAKYSASVAYQYWNCSNTKVFHILHLPITCLLLWNHVKHYVVEIPLIQLLSRNKSKPTKRLTLYMGRINVYYRNTACSVLPAHWSVHYISISTHTHTLGAHMWLLALCFNDST